MNGLTKFTIVAAGTFVLIQGVRPGIPSRSASAEIQVPSHIHRILDESCYSCHSDERRLAWFDQIQPAYWLVRDDILTARQHLNFSTLGAKPAAAQKAALYEAVNMIQLGAMPLPRFVALHPEAKVSPQDLQALKAYLAPWSSPPPGSRPASSNDVPLTRPDAVKPEWNGVSFDPSFKSWKPLSFTDRGDNNTFRFILGNDVAVKAAESGNIHPWPDGTRFAKIAWEQQHGSDGMIYPGNFIQVEQMTKDAKKYASTNGWGWGRWRGLDLKPYGTDARFVNECTGCHLPLKNNDYVYTLPMTKARSSLLEAVNNRAATLPSSLPYQPLHWTPITLFSDPKTHTLSVVYVNDRAMLSVPPLSGSKEISSYQPGAVLALVTWVLRDDPHWFGGRIPDVPASVEFLTVKDEKQTSYRRFSGADLSEQPSAPPAKEQRTGFLLGLKAAPLP